jgi:phosphoglycolate phosphatase
VSVERTMDDLGQPRPTRDGVRAVVGAPLRKVFAHLFGPGRLDLIEPAIVRYRLHFEEVGRGRIQLYPGLDETLESFRGVGHRMQVVTARSAPSAVSLVAQFRIDRFFEYVHAPALPNTDHDKADHVKAALDRAGITAADALFIGDRADDMRAASAHSVPAIGVLWGNGSRQELEAAGAKAVVQDASELRARVGAWRSDVVGSSRG